MRIGLASKLIKHLSAALPLILLTACSNGVTSIESPKRATVDSTEIVGETEQLNNEAEGTNTLNTNDSEVDTPEPTPVVSDHVGNTESDSDDSQLDTENTVEQDSLEPDDGTTLDEVFKQTRPNTDPEWGYDGFDVLSAELDLYPYRQDSRYASVLADCASASTVADSCSLLTLPFIGDGTTEPSVDDVMDRLLVTHNWMGERFESALRNAPADMTTLFASVAVIVIGSDVRPSFYQPLNAMIQLDPAYLWTTLNEKSSVALAADYRSGFGDELGFWFLGSFRNPSDGSPAWPYYSLRDLSTRTEGEMFLPLYRLLYHELAHAADAMPRDKLHSLDRNQSTWEAVFSVSDDWLSNRLQAVAPLTNTELMAIEQVRSRGEKATEAQKNATPAELGQMMGTDGAIQLYSYLTQYEDLAQLFTAVMMSYHFNAQLNVAFVSKPADAEDFWCDELHVGWGQRNRLADPLVWHRAYQATDLVLSLTPDIVAHLTALKWPEPMVNGASWCDNQVPANIMAANTLLSSGTNPVRTYGPFFAETIQHERLSNSHKQHTSGVTTFAPATHRLDFGSQLRVTRQLSRH